MPQAGHSISNQASAGPAPEAWIQLSHVAAEIFTTALGAEPGTERLYYKIGQGISRW